MKPQGIGGIVLIIVGVLILIYQGFSYTHKTQIAKVGPLEVNGEKQENVFISPIIGGVCLLGGVVLLAAGGRNS